MVQPKQLIGRNRAPVERRAPGHPTRRQRPRQRLETRGGPLASVI